MTKIVIDKDLIEQAIEAAFSPYCTQDLAILVPALRAALAEPAVEPCSELVGYILQDDIHNRLTPRVVDIAYSAFMLGRSGTNSDDGGPCDWFNDTKPMVMEQLAKVKKDLAEEAAPLRKPSPPPAEPAVEPISCQWLAEMIMADLGYSSNDSRMLAKITERIVDYDRSNAPPPPAEVPLLSDEEIGALVREASKGGALNRDGSTSQRIARAIEQAVRKNAGLK